MPRIKGWLTGHRGTKLILFMVLSMLLSLTYLKYKSVYFYGEYLLKIILGFVIIVFLLLVTIGREYGNRIIIYLSAISFEVYLIHGFVIGSLQVLAPELSSGKFIILAYAITVIFADVAHRISKIFVRRLRA